jgi:hypothetical protein
LGGEVDEIGVCEDGIVVIGVRWIGGFECGERIVGATGVILR